MVKVYELSRYDAMTVRIVYLGQTIMATFKGGNSARVRARLTTSDPFIQDAVEHDPRYGTLFVLTRKYEDCPSRIARVAEQDSKPKKIAKVKTVNDALLWFTQMGESITSEENLETMMEKWNVEFPNLKR